MSKSTFIVQPGIAIQTVLNSKIAKFLDADDIPMENTSNISVGAVQAIMDEYIANDINEAHCLYFLNQRLFDLVLENIYDRGNFDLAKQIIELGCDPPKNLRKRVTDKQFLILFHVTVSPRVKADMAIEAIERNNQFVKDICMRCIMDNNRPDSERAQKYSFTKAIAEKNFTSEKSFYDYFQKRSFNGKKEVCKTLKDNGYHKEDKQYFCDIMTLFLYESPTCIEENLFDETVSYAIRKVSSKNSYWRWRYWTKKYPILTKIFQNPLEELP